MSKNVGLETTKKANGTAGTELQILTKQTFVSMFILSAPASNTGKIFIGDSNVAYDNSGSGSGIFSWQLAPGETVSVAMPKNAGGEQIKLDLRVLWLDADVSGDHACLSHFNC